jgi:signal transduction histidine kinase/ActR/RegA family two-component response regulator
VLCVGRGFCIFIHEINHFVSPKNVFAGCRFANFFIGLTLKGLLFMKCFNPLLIGTSGIMDEEESNRIKLVNKLCIVAALVVAFIGCVLCSILSWRPFIVLPLSGEFLLNALVLLLNHRRRYVAAAFLLYLLQCVMVAYLGITLGRLLQLELVIILLIAITYLIFKKKSYRIIAVVAALADLVVLEFVYRYNYSRYKLPVSEGAAFVIHLFVLLTVIGVILMVSTPYVKSHDTNAELKRANNFIKIFVAQITHEIRTPLDSIHRVTQLLRSEIRKDPGLKKIQPLVDIGWTVSSNARHIVNNVLDMAEIEAGKTPVIVTEAFRLGPFLERILDVHQVIAEREDMTLDLLVDAEMPEVIFGDPLNTHQILTNLMANAFKYGSKGGIVRVNVKKQVNTWQLIVSNTGPGIPREKIASIFEPFFTGRVGQIEGSGLGLFIVKSKLNSMKGSIHVESVPGAVTVFTVTLPLREGGAWDLPVMPEAESVNTALRNIRVLVAEDDKLTTYLYSMFLKDMGCSFSIVKNGLELIQLAQEKCPDWCPDIIILDGHMPILNGEETIKRLKRLPDLNHIPIIVTTGDIYSDTVRRMLDAGAVDYLKKPIDHVALQRTIMEGVNRAQQV